MKNISDSEFCSLLDSGFGSKKMIDAFLGYHKIVGKDVFEAVDSLDYFTMQDKFDYFMDGRIEINFLEEMDPEFLTAEKLVELYKDPKSSSRYARYAQLYRDFVIKNKNENEKDEIGEEIVAATNGDFEEEDLVRFYEQYLISLSTVEAWGGSSLITDMMKQAKLRPVDLKELCREGNYDAVLDIMGDSEISRETKLAILYTTFYDADDSLTDEERELANIARDEAIELIGFDDGNTPSKKKKGGHGDYLPGSGGGTSGSGNMFVIDPLVRWNTIELLDPEFSYVTLDKGLMIFKLPNIGNGVIILEKMFKGGKLHWGRATKRIMMPIEDFERIQDSLEVRGDIPPYMVDDHPAFAGKLESIPHDKYWARNLCASVNYKTDPRRTPENVEAIDGIVEKCKISRRLLEK